jgi:hypothetical protein
VNNLSVSFPRKVVDFLRRGGPILRWRLALGLIAAVIAVWLLIAQKPWVVAAQIRGKMDALDYVQIYGWTAGAINIALLAHAGHHLALGGPATTSPDSTSNPHLPLPDPLDGSGPLWLPSQWC